MWKIVDGPQEVSVPSLPDDPDLLGFVYLLERADGTVCKVMAVCTGTVMSMCPECLHRRLREFQATRGRSEVERVLDRATPPRRIEVTELRPEQPIYTERDPVPPLPAASDS